MKRVDEKLLMYERGTLKYEPTARVLLQAAQAAILYKRENARINRDRLQAKAAGAKATMAGKAKKSAWLPQHVRAAGSASELLALALKEYKDGCKSKNVETLILYSSPARLEQALELARAAEVAELGGGGNSLSGSRQADWVGNSNR